MARSGDDCDPKMLWLQIPFFCGHAKACWEPGSSWALERAKENLLQHYLLVGVTEEILEFISVLEAVVPNFFAGATETFLNGDEMSHVRKTNYKQDPLPETIATVKQWKTWEMEHEFYEFAKEQFHFVRDLTLVKDDQGRYRPRKKQFHYDKIKPS